MYSMMQYRLMVIGAYIQQAYSFIDRVLQYCRRHVALPIALQSSRDMVLLHNGHWVIDHADIPTKELVAFYKADRHTILSLDTTPNDVRRCSLLSVIAGGKDISDFFSSLRISNGLVLSDEALLMLYTNQKGWCSTDDVVIMDRSGDIRQTPSLIDDTSTRVSDNSYNHIPDLNYIR